LIIIGLLCGVSFAYASPIKDAEILRHHRGMQNISHTTFSKTSTCTVAHGHRGIYNIRLCENMPKREKHNDNSLRHRGEQSV
jgi:hypothetical protein